MGFDEERWRQWDNEMIEKQRVSRETMHEYARRFQGRVVALLYAAVQRGGCSAEELARWERPPVIAFCMQEAASRLAGIGNRLGD